MNLKIKDKYQKHQANLQKCFLMQLSVEKILILHLRLCFIQQKKDGIKIHEKEKSIGEMLYASMAEYLKALDKQNKKNRVIAAQHQALDVATSPHSPRSSNTLSQHKKMSTGKIQYSLKVKKYIPTLLLKRIRTETS